MAGGERQREVVAERLRSDLTLRWGAEIVQKVIMLHQDKAAFDSA